MLGSKGMRVWDVHVHAHVQARHGSRCDVVITSRGTVVIISNHEQSTAVAAGASAAAAAGGLTSSFMDLSPLEPPPLEKVKMRGWVVAMAADAFKAACEQQAQARLACSVPHRSRVLGKCRVLKPLKHGHMKARAYAYVHGASLGTWRQKNNLDRLSELLQIETEPSALCSTQAAEHSGCCPDMP